jgi:hypothetical protein
VQEIAQLQHVLLEGCRSADRQAQANRPINQSISTNANPIE